MEKKDFDFNSDFNNVYQFGKWTLSYNSEQLCIDEHGGNFQGLYLMPYEEPETITFDTENKTVSVKVKYPLFNEKQTRTIDLHDSPEFFNELRKDIGSILMQPTQYGTLFNSVTTNENRTEFKPQLRHFTSNETIEYYNAFQMGNCFAGYHPNIFQICNQGVKLAFSPDEIPETITFDTENKTVSVKVKYPTLPPDTPRTADLHDSPEFFNELRNRMEILLTSEYNYRKTFEKVSVNDNRTIFNPYVYEKREYTTNSHKGFRMGGWNEWNVWTSNDGKELFAISYTDDDNHDNDRLWTLINYGEKLENITFDTENKTLSVKVKSDNIIRTVDLKDAVWLFDELTKEIPNLLQAI